MRVCSMLFVASLILFGAVAPASAKPKKIVSEGCTAEQIQSSTASPCVDKMQDDILHNRPRYHYVYCSSTGAILCCEADASTGQTVDHSCQILSRRIPGQVIAPPPATVQPLTAPPKSGPATPRPTTRK